MKRGWWVGTAVLSLLGGQARADDFPPVQNGGAAPSGPAAAPDVVLLKNGGIAKGTISELLPGDHVVLVLLSGGTRTFPMAEVKYAGPAADAPRATSDDQSRSGSNGSSGDTESRDGYGRVHPLVTVHAEEAKLALTGSEPNLTFHVSTGAATAGWVSAIGYDRICTAPCNASIAAGTYTLALSSENHAPISTEKPITLRPGRSNLAGTYTSNGGVRAAGWVVMFVGPAAGLASMLLITKEECLGGGTSLDPNPICTNRLTATGVAIGGALVVGSVLIGFALITVKDSAEIRVSPGSGAGSTLGSGPTNASLDAFGGAHLHGRF
jgi:hypothetical protein